MPGYKKVRVLNVSYPSRPSGTVDTFLCDSNAEYRRTYLLTYLITHSITWCFRSPLCPVYAPGAARGQRGVGGGCWPGVAPPGPAPLRCYDEPVAAAVQSFTAWRQNLLAISAAAAAAGATSGIYHGRTGLEHHRQPPASTVLDGPLSLRFDHCRLPTALMMSHQDGSDINNTGWL